MPSTSFVNLIAVSDGVAVCESRCLEGLEPATLTEISRKFRFKEPRGEIRVFAVRYHLTLNAPDFSGACWTAPTDVIMGTIASDDRQTLFK